ncbi:helix-turn-helix domain-containing protein [Mycobacterium genavense]|uniref:AraC-like ligand-binding domain-containing protein n=1 Tax=Mycobacterium genavense TaxID=36812 RepID=UPI0009FBE006|nr:helix-turn-helix domain-containing protein [Mycobacterium genavense]
MARRTRKLTSASSPEYLKVGIQLSGVSAVSQEDRQVCLGPGDIILYDTTRPYEISTGASFRMQTVMFPRPALRLSPGHLEHLRLRPISGEQGLGLLVAQYLVGLRRQLDGGVPLASSRLADATLDLLAALFAEQLAVEPGGSSNAGLLLRVQAYIENQLSDPYLDVPSIAAAHYISVRTLQKLFEGAGQTVTGWIRIRRLEHCRKDLSNPDLAERSIASIAANWGLIDPSHFSRMFSSTYGVCPRDYCGGKSAASVVRSAPA